MGSAFRHAVPLAWIAAIVGIHQASAQEPVDIELVLAVDMSISVDGAEFDLQRQGLVAAFRDPTVIEAIRANAQGMKASKPNFRRLPSSNFTPIAGVEELLDKLFSKSWRNPPEPGMAAGD